MKRIFLCVLLLNLISCSQNDEIIPASDNAAHLRTLDNPAGNSNNPYDLAGQVHDELMMSYFGQSPSVFTIETIAEKVELAAGANVRFKSLPGAHLPRMTAQRAQNWIGHESNAITDAIESSSLSSPAKVSLSNFTSTLLSMNSTLTDFESFYTFIEGYETNVLNSGSLTSWDKERLLTIASISRYATFRAKKKPKKNTDPDWDYLVLSLAGGIDGGERNAAESVVNSLTCGILQNQ